MTLPITAIKRAVAHHYGITTAELNGPSRKRQHAHPRQVAYLMLQRHRHLSLPEIGRAFGGRDHTTVLFGITRAKAREALPEVAADIEAIEAALGAEPMPIVFRTSRAK